MQTQGRLFCLLFLLFVVLFLCLTLIAMAVMFNQTNIYYDPEIIMNRITYISIFFYAAYAAFLLLPMALQIAGEIKQKNSLYL